MKARDAVRRAGRLEARRRCAGRDAVLGHLASAANWRTYAALGSSQARWRESIGYDSSAEWQRFGDGLAFAREAIAAARKAGGR